MARTLTQSVSAQLNHSSEGTVYLYAEYDLHEGLDTFSIKYPDFLTPVKTSGFSESQLHRCEWDSSTRHPWIKFDLNVNQTNTAGYEYVDTGQWALLKYPPLSASWEFSYSAFDSHKPEYTLEREYDVRGDGIVSNDGRVAFLGPHREEQFTAASQLFRLAIPDAASLSPPLEEVRGTLRFAAEHLDVNGRNDEVVVVVAPSTINWGWGGLQTGENGFWVVDRSNVNHPNNTWIHEYVHTRQIWSQHSSTEWLVEGTTNYYAALYTVREDRIPFSLFHRHLATDMHSDSVLADPNRWSSPKSHYTKGRRVVAALDAKIRRETDGDRSFEDVFKRMNTRDTASEPLTHEVFKSILDDVAGSKLVAWVEKYVEKPAVPPVPQTPDLFGPDIPKSTDGPESEDDEIEEEVTEPVEEVTKPEEVEEPGFCPVCGASVDEGQEYCNRCGTTLFRQCPVCGRSVGDDPYCPECGTAITKKCEVCGFHDRTTDEYCPQCGTAF